MKPNIVTYVGTVLDHDKEQIVVVEVPLVPGKDYGEVIFIGDLHIGHKAFAKNQLVKYLKFIKDNSHIRIIGMGDYFESVEFSGYYQESEKGLREQIKDFIDLFYPVSKQIIALIYGNHDERFAVASKDAIDLLDYVRLKLGNPDIAIAPPQRGLIIVIKLKKGNKYKYYPIYIHHSSTSATINLESQFRRTAKNYKVPLIVHGHTHRIFWKDNTSFSVSYINGEFYRSILRQYWLSTGSFIKYAGYAEAKSMGPPDIKAPLIRFHFSKDVIEYKDPTTEWIDLHGSNEATIEWIKENRKIEVDVTLQRPPCPKCGSIHIISKGVEWQCADCHRRYMKKSIKGDKIT